MAHDEELVQRVRELIGSEGPSGVARTRESEARRPLLRMARRGSVRTSSRRIGLSRVQVGPKAVLNAVNRGLARQCAASEGMNSALPLGSAR